MYQLVAKTSLGVRRIISRKEQSQHFAQPFPVDDGAMQIDVYKTLFHFYSKSKMPHVPSTVTNMCFIHSNSQAYYDNFQNIVYLQIFHARKPTSQRSIAMVANERNHNLTPWRF